MFFFYHLMKATFPLPITISLLYIKGIIQNKDVHCFKLTYKDDNDCTEKEN